MRNEECELFDLYDIMRITISNEFQQKYPGIKLGVVLAKVQIKAEYPALLAQIEAEVKRISESLVIEDISKLPAISAARRGYKAVGKDPARYRLSAEALLRRVVSGKGLYQINNVVDALNLVSLKSGISIGGYDFEKIHGDISLGIGRAAEHYEGIGRGILNIEYMPVLRDEDSAFGSPTSDSMRTMVTQNTQQFLMVFFSFDGLNNLEENMKFSKDLLAQFADGKLMDFGIVG